jgi:hypothetical protein
MPTPLEQEFHQAMVNIYDRAKNEANYVATRYIQMVAEHGGVATAKTLINADRPSDGYTALWERRRLDLTVEALIQNPKWAPLFIPEEIEKARQRLKEYGYDAS